MGDVDFSDLVNEAEHLATEFEAIGELPKIERSIKQVLEASQALWTRVTATGPQDLQANILLGTKGLDLPQVTHKLQSLSSRKTFEPLEPVPLTDIPSFLKNETENAIIQLIDATHRSTYSGIDKLHKNKIFDEWHNHKTNLMNSLVGYSNEIIDVPARREISIASETRFGISSTLDQDEMAYAKCLIDYNNATLQGLPKPNLLEKFSEASEAFNNQKLCEMWKMLRYMTDVPPQGKGDAVKARCEISVQERMVQQALAYLEERYKEFMNSVISGNMNAAKRGGVPGSYPLVRGFVNVKLTGNEPGLTEKTVDGLPLWPHIYYSLRCGDISAALQCIKSAEMPKEDMVAVLQDLKESPHRRLDVTNEMKVKTEYKRIVGKSPDPYKRLVYCLLGACDVHDDHRAIANTADDYLWLKLWQVRETETDATHSIRYSFLQSLVLEDYGEQYYKASEQPHVFFQMLILTGQWESAIDFLIRVDKYRSHAVHMAIAIHELNLLALPASINSPLLVIDEIDPPPMRRLNLLRLILLYTRKFETSDPKETLHYYFTLRHLPGSDNKNAFATCVVNLMIETKQYDLVLGHLEDDGCRIPGLLDSLDCAQINTKAITESIAHIAESKGLLEDAVKLYDLCGRHENVLTLLNTLLSQVLSRPTTDAKSTRTRLVNTAYKVHLRYRGQELNCKNITLLTFNMLRDLIIFFDMYHSKEYNKALEIIHKIKILPLQEDEMEDRINNFKLLEDTITRNIPDILLATMHIYHFQYTMTQGEKEPSRKLEDGNKTKQLSFIRERAKLLTSFAGTIPYRMPGDTNSRLVQLEIMMN
ncbi:nuclear pore complex protein Nup93-like isoform X1 [Rhodnius prolixus]